ncbi:hypothetical protein GN244_ATG01536 [Phytophthora infestans]|uniref:Uncharacterized protein n=1 Tax=Phytophthora infestans TaxID=4787 RepID=A0A833T3R2_PHYIN|nr:hypothetical protein GN244_ATG01536 [Phytophthora infestans]KAF4132911.1 hypothetical protein GN958_ATG17901 [Phytophthora infestans]
MTVELIGNTEVFAITRKLVVIGSGRGGCDMQKTKALLVSSAVELTLRRLLSPRRSFEGQHIGVEEQVAYGSEWRQKLGQVASHIGVELRRMQPAL